jgi:hypothetical protein
MLWGAANGRALIEQPARAKNSARPRYCFANELFRAGFEPFSARGISIALSTPNTRFA